jgi:hypothetical protein
LQLAVMREPIMAVVLGLWSVWWRVVWLVGS